MKNITRIGLLLIFATILVYACKKKETTTTSTTPAATINAKWMVTGSSAAQFTSFEFNKGGSYIVVMPASTKFGSYTTSGTTMNLVNFGSITITKLEGSTFNFILTTPGKSSQSTFNITTTKATEISLTGNTALLCRTWSLFTMDSVPVAGTVYECEVMFTQAGTYFVHYEIDSTSAMAQWKWKDNTMKQLCYSWAGAPTCDGISECTINSITASKLIMTESYYGTHYVLVPFITKNSLPFNNPGVPVTINRFLGR